MKNIVGLRDLRENTDKYVSQVKKGRSFTIVRRSRPIFRITPVDEWGDEGAWETIVDFTKISPTGVPIADVRKALKELKKIRVIFSQEKSTIEVVFIGTRGDSKYKKF